MYYQVEYEDYDGQRYTVLARSQEEVRSIINALDTVTQNLQRVTPLYIDLECNEFIEETTPEGLELG